MKTREELTYMFQTGDCAYMLSVHPRTVIRWSNLGKISFKFDEMMKRKIYPLEEINRIRRMQQVPPLSKEEALDIWKERHGEKIE